MSAQGAQAEFERLFIEGIGLGVEAASPKEYRAAIDRLDSAASLVDQLAPTRQGAARFAVGVRKAEVYLRGGAVERALETARATRAAARADATVYVGYYRVLLLTLLRETMPEHEFLDLVSSDGEESFLFAEDTLATVRSKQRGRLYVPLRIMRYDVLNHRGETVRAFRSLQRLADEIRPRDDVPPGWRRECFRSLVWHLIERKYLDRAELYLGDLDPRDQAYVRGRIARDRGDYRGAVREGRALVAQEDPALQLLGHQLAGEGLEGLKRVEEAREEYRRALALTLDPQQRAVLLNDLGDCQRQLNDLDGARERYEEALEYLAPGDLKYVEAERAENYKDLGLLAEAGGDLAAAHEWYIRTLDELDQARREIPIDLLGAKWLRADYFDAAVEGVIRTAAAAGHDLFDALAATERGRARGLLDWMHSPPQPDQLGALQGAIRRLSVVTDPAEVEARRVAVERARDLAQREGLRAASTLTGDELRDAQQAAPGTLFLSYWVGPRTARVFVGRGGSPTLELLELGPRRQALALLRGAHEAVADPSEEPYEALDRAAGFFVPAGVAAAIAAAERVVFCPDSNLHRLPFEALRIEGRPLGVAAELEWVPSLSVRAELEQREERGRAIVVVDSVEAGPAYEALGVDRLTFSSREGDTTAAHYAGGEDAPPMRRLSGEAATFAALDSALEAEPASLLHISSHAIASAFVPSGSLLLLSSGPESMATLAQLSLRGSVVVFSACSTATGEASGGEGVAGVLWGPMAAGARSVIASLWSVNQEATTALMDRFHAHRARGLGEAAALRAAREELAASARFGHPHYWAGFVAYGSRRHNPVLASAAPWSPPVWVWVATLGGLLIVLGVFARLRAR